MTHAPPLSTVQDPRTPEEVLPNWPQDRPLAAFGVGSASPWSRWAILAEPAETLVADDPLSLHRLISRVFAPPTRPPPPPGDDDAPPFASGWIGSLGYRAGRLLEPRAAAPDPPSIDRPLPAAFFHRCPRAWCYDKGARRWFGPPDSPSLPTTPPTRFEVVRTRAPAFVAGPFEPGPHARDRYQAAVRSALELIRAGDVYQVNVAHRLSGLFFNSPRLAFSRLASDARPWYGALLELESPSARSAILSASPELFFRFDARSRTLTTRPMKGTRPAGQAGALAASPKDRAELAMIVDLMRNDLGRVCDFGSVRVDQNRTIEQHGDVLQAVSSVSGRLRDALTLADAVRALFPGGSITGAPKIRAMQIIEELEEADRGPYCGALGFVSDSGDACFSMAIRTLAISGAPGTGPDEIVDGTADYWVGAGIVADSVPEEEWAETLVKASPLRRAFGG